MIIFLVIPFGSHSFWVENSNCFPSTAPKQCGRCHISPRTRWQSAAIPEQWWESGERNEVAFQTNTNKTYTCMQRAYSLAKEIKIKCMTPNRSPTSTSHLSYCVYARMRNYQTRKTLSTVGSQSGSLPFQISANTAIHQSIFLPILILKRIYSLSSYT